MPPRTMQIAHSSICSCLHVSFWLFLGLQLRRWPGTWPSWPVRWPRVMSAACTASGGPWASLYLQNHLSPSLTSPQVNTLTLPYLDILIVVKYCFYVNRIIYLSVIWDLNSELRVSAHLILFFLCFQCRRWLNQWRPCPDVRIQFPSSLYNEIPSPTHTVS